jgi:dihydrodipicolinate synthase/N-acetylneuraminate lyase
MLLHGIFVPVTTPFYPDGSLYWRKLEHNVARYSRTPLAGLVVLESSGEAALLSDQERRDVLKCVRAVTAPEKVLLAGTGRESALETLRLTEYAAELGYDAVLVISPGYYRAQMTLPGNLLAFYRFVADRSPLPVVMQNAPSLTGHDLAPQTVLELAAHPNIIGILEPGEVIGGIPFLLEHTRGIKRTVPVTLDFQALTPRMLKAAAAPAAIGGVIPTEALTPSSSAVAVTSGLKTREKEVGFQILAGAAENLYAALRAGAVGAMPAFANPAPTAVYEVHAAWKDGDYKLAQEKQERITVAAARIAGELAVPGIKYACDLNGYYGGPVRLPLLPLTAEVKREVELLMKDIRN